jgi:hypothetical protein
MGAVSAKSSTATMKTLFRRSIRYRRRARRLPKGFAEVELLPGLTVEDVLATGATWEDFLRLLQSKVVWMAPDIYIHSQRFGGGDESLVFLLGVPGGTKLFVRVTWGTPAAVATATCDFLVRLLATCEQHNLLISGLDSGVPPPISGAALSLFFQESRSCLRRVTFFQMALDADQCLALTTMSRLDVKLDICHCTLVDDAAGAFVECLQSDRGPVELNDCDIRSHVLASALTGNSRVTRFKPDDAEMAVLFVALASNRGLEELDFEDGSISDDNWGHLCESLKAHPTLTNLNLINTRPWGPAGGLFRMELTGAQKAHRLAEMVQHNTVLHTIKLSQHARDEEIYAQMILPCLETNRYRPRVHAIKKADLSLRRPLLGRALQTESVRKDSNLRWMFLSGNADVLVRPN